MLRTLASRGSQVIRSSSVIGWRFSSAAAHPVHDAHHDSADAHHHEQHFEVGKVDPGEILTGAFGTIDKPVVVTSVFDNRIVGCMGGNGDEGHSVLWHWVTKDKPLICLECGQTFLLKKISVPGHHDHGHDSHGDAHGHGQSHSHGHH